MICVTRTPPALAPLSRFATALPAAFAMALRKSSRPDWASNTTILRR